MFGKDPDNQKDAFDSEAIEDVLATGEAAILALDDVTVDRDSIIAQAFNSGVCGNQSDARSFPDEAVIAFPLEALQDFDDATDEAADILDEAQYTPGIKPDDIPQEVLDELLPGDEAIVLPKVSLARKPIYSFAKRAFDVVSCSLALLVLALPMALVALKVKLDSPGPVIYAQRRVGKGGRVFRMYKFRSMYLDAEAKGARWAAGDDPRVTPFGRLMRRTRIDELPQFWNVVKGDMSLVGPRPERPAFAEEFEKRIVGFNQRTLVRPGVTGLAQVTGGYELLPKNKVAYDLEYIKGRSIHLDLRILAQTVVIVFTGRGAR